MDTRDEGAGVDRDREARVDRDRDAGGDRDGDRDVDLVLEQRLDHTARHALLERVAFTLGSTLDLKEVLRRLGEIVHETASAQRCSIVLIDGDRLRPAVAIGSHPDEDLWSAFRSMPPIELDSEQWTLMRRGRAIAVEDARETTVIPQSWVERFSLRAVALVPLAARGEPCGVMAVDWPEVRPVDDDELALLEAIGTYAGVAVHNARLHDRVARKSRIQEHVVEVAASLNSSTSLSRVLELICTSYEQLLGATHTSVNINDPADPLTMETIATRGEPWPAGMPSQARVMAPEELMSDEGMWRSSAGPVVYPRLAVEEGRRHPPSLRSAALFPLFGPDGLIGSVVTGFAQSGGPDPDELDTGQTLAELAATAIGRADLHEQLRRRVRQLEILSQLGEVVAGIVNLDQALAQVNEVLTPEFGIELRSVAVCDESLREAFGARGPDEEEARAIESWEEMADVHGRPVGLRAGGDDLFVPIVHRDAVRGVVRVATNGSRVDISDEEFLLAVGASAAEVLDRASLSRSLQATERRLAVSAERERIAEDLHDSTGQVLAGMRLRLADWLEEAPDPVWAERLETVLDLARAGERELREAVHSLLFVQVQEDGLLPSLEDFVVRFERVAGVEVDLRVPELPVLVGADREAALFRVVHEGLMNVERHAGATRAEVELREGLIEAVLEVRDDGVGFGGATLSEEEEGHFGLQVLRRRLGRVDGALELDDRDGGGAVLRATVPLM